MFIDNVMDIFKIERKRRVFSGDRLFIPGFIINVFLKKIEENPY